MPADFNWVCANYVYTPLDIFSTAGYKEFADITEHTNNIETSVIVGLGKAPEAKEYDREIQRIMDSKCKLTIVVTQASQIAHVVYRAYKKGYTGEFLVGSAGLSLPDELKKLINPASVEDVKEMMQGVIAVDVFNGDGTERFVLQL